MSTNEIIQDNGKTVSSEVYIRTLQEHPYIPQADQKISNITNNLFDDIKNNIPFGEKFEVLDLGCGPGRLTSKIDRPFADYFSYTGVDISDKFISYAEKKFRDKPTPDVEIPERYKKTRFLLRDFSSDPMFDFENKVDVIVIQGVMHHIHGDDRSKWLRKCFDVLKPNGIMVVGDEFIRDYEDEDQRKVFVAEFYCHIIDEARKGGFNELAEEEAKNLIDDAFSNTKYAGFHNQKALDSIYHYSKIINEMFYENGTLRSDGYNQIQNLFRSIRDSVEDLVVNYDKSLNRGDYKVSINEFSEEVSLHGFALEEMYSFGPVKQLGGIGVLVFKKQDILML